MLKNLVPKIISKTSMVTINFKLHLISDEKKKGSSTGNIIIYSGQNIWSGPSKI